MRKISALARMRMARDAREDAVVKPVRDKLRNINAMQEGLIGDLRKNIDAMSAVVNSPIADHIIADMRQMLVERLEPEIMRALGAAYRAGQDDIVTVSLPAETLRFLRPNEAAELILDRVQARYRAGVSSRAVRQVADRVTVLRVTLPQLVVEISVADMPAKRRA